MKAQLLVLLVIASVFTQTLDNLPGVPEDLIDKAQEALTASVPQLQRFSARRYCKSTLYKAIKNVVDALNQIKEVLNNNNVIVGDNNALSGQDNVIIGSDNVVQGDNNWLIQVNEFEGQIQQTLIYKDWAIKINRIDLILVNPRFVIRLINPEDRIKYRHFFKNFQGKGEHRRSRGYQMFFGKLKHQTKQVIVPDANNNPTNTQKKQQKIIRWQGFHVHSYNRNGQCDCPKCQQQSSHKENFQYIPCNHRSYFPNHPDHKIPQANKINDDDEFISEDEAISEETVKKQQENNKKIPSKHQAICQKAATQPEQKKEHSQQRCQFNAPKVSIPHCQKPVVPKVTACNAQKQVIKCQVQSGINKFAKPISNILSGCKKPF